MTTPNTPLLSVILITPDHFRSIRRVVDHLRAQNIRDRIELVIVAPDRDRLDLDLAAIDGFFGHQIVPVGVIRSVGNVVALAVQRAKAEIVVYVEEHSYPARGWAEAIVKAHQGDWSAVGPSLVNENPDTIVSWTFLYLEFGNWVAPVSAGVVPLLPSHQTSYKRQVLLSYGERLGEMLETETTLLRDLASKGHRFYLESSAQTSHLNVARLSDAIAIQFHNYRTFAANRAEHAKWPVARRLLYVVGSPLIPIIRGARVLKQIRRSGRTSMLPRMFVPMTMGLLAGMVGEVAGFIFGQGAAPQHRVSFEIERLRYVTDRDRKALGVS